MANKSYATTVNVCEDTSKNVELFDLLKQADPNYSAVDPARIKLYVYDGTKWVLTSGPGFFSAVDKDTFTLDAGYLPNFNGVQMVRVLGYDSTGNTFTLDLTVNVTPVNDAPSGADETVNVANGDTYVLGLADFGFTDSIDGNAFQSVVVNAVPSVGTLLLGGAPVTAGQEILASDIAAGKLIYVAPTGIGGDVGFVFQVRDNGGVDPDCGGVDLDATPNTITFHVPVGSLATLGDTVWLDTNANGVQDAGEAGIAGVTVILKDAAGNPVGTTTTDANGNYSFSVVAGTYSVAIVAPAGYVVTAPNQGGNDATDSDVDGSGQSAPVTLAAGEINNTVDAGLYKLAELGDRVWLDTNGNGLQDAGEAGVAGVKVTLLDAAGNAVGSPLTTDANGNYLFTGLKPGTYSVQFDKTTLPAGYAFTTRDAGADGLDSDADVTTGKTIQTVLDSGESDRTWDAGIKANVGIDIEKFVRGRYLAETSGGGEGLTPGFWKTHAAGGSAVEAGWAETGYAPGDSYEAIFGVDVPGSAPSLVQALGSNGGGVDALLRHSSAALLNAANPYVDYAYTKAQIIAMVQSAFATGNYEATKDLFATQNELGADLNTPSTGTATVVETPDYDADFVGPVIPVGGQAIFTYRVTNTGDVALSDVKVTDDRIPSLTFVGGDTDGDNKLDVGETWVYTATETVKAGVQYVNIGTATGTDAVSGRQATDSDAAHYTTSALTSSIGDRIWEDRDGDGMQDAGELGIAGVTVKLLDSAGNVVATTTTDVNGNYLFDVAPGTYSVAIVAPAGYLVTLPNQGSDASDSDFDAASLKTGAITVTAGEQNLSVDGGLYRAAELGDRVWIDANGNGQQDAGEAGVAGVKVTLLNASGVAVGSPLITDANGNYLFTGLRPGTYSVQFDKTTLPAGYSFTTANSGSDATDSDASQVDGKTAQTVLDSGESDRTWDAGIVAPVNTAAYGDKVWLDKNANGIQDAGEAGLAGVTVKLLNSAGTVVATTTTDANGNYLFNNLTPGDYAAQVVAPTGYFISAKDQGSNDAIDSDFDPTTGKTVLTTISTGEKDLSWDAGLYQKASIGDKVWADCNNNGLQDAGEAGVPGVVVKLLDASGNVVATTLTDGNGNYLFKDLMPGTYSVQFVAPAGYTFTTKDVGSNDAIDSDVGAGVVLGTTNLIVNGSFENGSTGWCGNGDSIEINTAGAYGVSGVTGAMVAELDANTTCTVTGFYQDVATVAGQSYQLTVDLAQRSGTAAATNTVEIWWEGTKIATVDPTSTALTKYTFTVKAVDGSSRLEFREQAGDDDSLGGIIDNVRLVTVSGSGAAGTTVQTVLESGENDMSWDAGLTVVPVTATFDFSGNSATSGTMGNVLCFSDSGIAVNASAFSRDKATGAWTTAFLGSYGGGLGVTDGSEGTGSGNTHTVDNNGTRDNYVLFEFSQSVVVDKAYLGYVVGDSDAKVWIGTVNGAFNSHIALSDAVLSSMGFTEVSATTLTSARWADINAGSFVGNVLVVAAAPGETDDYFKIQNLVVNTPSAFCATDVSIGDKVWNDVNMNGVQDAGEAGMAGVTVKLLNSAGAVITTTTTDANGNYLFDKLAAGDYKIQVVTPTGYTITGKDVGGNDATDSDIDASGTTALYTLTQGSNNLTVDAGFYKTPVATAKIGDRVWEDKNFNGIQDAGEAGIQGVTVKLLNTAGAVVATATTDANGNYVFSNLVAGSYTVQVVAPTGYYVTTQNAAGYNGTDSAINASGYTGTIALAEGQTLTKVDAGLYRKASVGDKVWLDSDNDGYQDSGECGIANVTVKLLNSAGAVIASTCTDSSGNYKFTNLDPGQYSLQFDKSSAYYYTGQCDWWGNPITKSVSSSGYQWTVKDVGSNAYDAIDNDVARVSSTYYNQGYTDKFTLVSGQYDNTRDGGVCPLVIDLDGNGIHTISRENGNGTFDLLGTGQPIHSGWLSAGDAFLVIDANGNGRIDDISEMFGGNGAGQGFAKLAAFDSNGDGVVDARDADFAHLSVWRDLNGDGKTDAGELMSLSDAGVASLKVSYAVLPAIDEQGNLHLERSSATLSSGASVDMTDVYFNVDAAEVRQAGGSLPSMAELLGNDASLDQVLGAPVAVGAVAAAPAAATVSDAAVAALGQLCHLYEEQQHQLVAA